MDFIAVILLCVSFIFLLISVIYFLAHIGMLFGFQKGTKITEAKIVGNVSRGLDDYGNARSYCPIIEYYNEFQGKLVKKETLNFGTPVLHTGEKVKIQYNTKAERCVDERFIKPGRYKISKYIVPIAVSASVGFAGFIILVVSIIL